MPPGTIADLVQVIVGLIELTHSQVRLHITSVSNLLFALWHSNAYSSLKYSTMPEYVFSNRLNVSRHNESFVYPPPSTTLAGLAENLPSKNKSKTGRPAPIPAGLYGPPGACQS